MTMTRETLEARIEALKRYERDAKEKGLYKVAAVYRKKRAIAEAGLKAEEVTR